MYRKATAKHAYEPVLANLQPDDLLVMYHGTYVNEKDRADVERMLQMLKHGIDTEGREEGLFVTPNINLARHFGDALLKMHIPAKNLHATDWMGSSGPSVKRRQDAKWIHELCAEIYPDSFNPVLSCSLSEIPNKANFDFRGYERQAVFRGYLPSENIVEMEWQGLYDEKADVIWDLEDMLSTFSRLEPKVREGATNDLCHIEIECGENPEGCGEYEGLPGYTRNSLEDVQSVAEEHGLKHNYDKRLDFGNGCSYGHAHVDVPLDVLEDILLAMEKVMLECSRVDLPAHAPQEQVEALEPHYPITVGEL